GGLIGFGEFADTEDSRPSVCVFRISGIIVERRNLDAVLGKYRRKTLVRPFFAVRYIGGIIRKERNQLLVRDERVTERIGAKIKTIVEGQPANARDRNGDGRIIQIEPV